MTGATATIANAVATPSRSQLGSRNKPWMAKAPTAAPTTWLRRSVATAVKAKARASPLTTRATVESAPNVAAAAIISHVHRRARELR